MNKTIILAICGKSASGKSTLATALHSKLVHFKIDSHLILSDTTRPSRPNEQDLIDYNFIDLNYFLDKKVVGEYIETTRFKGWEYGTPKSEIKDGMVNIGVFNVSGLEQLQLYQDKYTIIPILLECNLFTRLARSKEREGKIKLEFLRRAYTDAKDFKEINKILKRFKLYVILPPRYSCFHNVNDIIFDLRLANLIPPLQ